MSSSIFERLVAFLEAVQVPHTVLRHEPVLTSEDAARVRGTPLASDAKALVCKCDDRFAMIVMPADRRLSSKKARLALRVRSLRFATADEVLEMTSLRPGSIPPFGSLFGLPTFCDAGLRQQPRINFNAGDHSISISMSSADFERVEKPEYGAFADEA